MKDIEFIIVDDGSTDGSAEICDEYVAKNSRFRVIHQFNGGLASARQTGLEAAKGDYIIVCDSDDWVEPNIYEHLYNKAIETNADIVCCGYFAEYNDGKSIPSQLVFKESNGVVDNFDFISRGAGSSWVKLVKRSLFIKARASYEPGINMGEDSLILYKLMKANPKVVQLTENLYHYRRNFGGETYTNNIKMTHVHQLGFTYYWLKENYKDEEYEPIRFRRAIDLAFACIRTTNIDKVFLSNFFCSELPLRRFLSNKKDTKSLFVLFEKYMPLSFSKFIFRLIYKYIYK